MKTKIKILIVGLFLMGIGIGANAQVSASASATGTILTPIKITKTVDMSFGNIAVNTSLGTVVLTTSNSRTSNGGVTLPTTLPGTITSASFTIEGAANYTYSIIIPSTDVILKHTNNTDQMIANAFVSLPATTGTLDGSGTQTLKVGATLNVSGSQLAGVYTTGTSFPVTVNYN